MHKKCKNFPQKSTTYLVHIFDPLNNLCCIFMLDFFFICQNWKFFFQFSSFFPLKSSFLGLEIPRFPRLISSRGIPHHEIPWFLVPHEEWRHVAVIVKISVCKSFYLLIFPIWIWFFLQWKEECPLFWKLFECTKMQTRTRFFGPFLSKPLVWLG